MNATTVHYRYFLRHFNFSVNAFDFSKETDVAEERVEHSPPARKLRAVGARDGVGLEGVSTEEELEVTID